MPMIVVEVKDTTVVCDAFAPNGVDIFPGGWEFDIETGTEEDVELGWGVKFGKTGSRLILDGEEK
jgi:hypothetical protein